MWLRLVPLIAAAIFVLEMLVISRFRLVISQFRLVVRHDRKS